MVMGSIPQEVDIAIVGGGVGGYCAAIRAARDGKERRHSGEGEDGGQCPNYACIPSKTMIHISDLFYRIKNSEKFGIHVDNEPSTERSSMTGASRSRTSWRWAIETVCKENGVDIFKAEATFLSSSTLQLSDGITLRFKKAIIATGSVPRSMPGFEFGGRVIDYKRSPLLDYIPANITIIGAGYVSVEIGTMFAKLGSKVYIIARSDVLSKFDRDAVNLVKERMVELGIDLRTGVTPSSQTETGLKLSDGSRIVTDLIVVATGLEPYTKGLGLENTKVSLDEGGFIKVDDMLQTTDPDIYALGDVVGEPMLAHKSMRQGAVAGEAAAGGKAYFDNLVIPAVIFTDPEIAIAGSIEPGDDINIVNFLMSAIGRAIALDQTHGFGKIAYQKRTGLIKGVEIAALTPTL